MLEGRGRGGEGIRFWRKVGEGGGGRWVWGDGCRDEMMGWLCYHYDGSSRVEELELH